MSFVRRTLALLAVAAVLPLAVPVRADDAQALTIVSPEAGALLDTPSTSVTVRSSAGEHVILTVNATAIPDDQIASVVKSADGSLLETWFGVSLHAGRNVISARVDRGDIASAPAEVQVAVRGDAVKLVLSLDHRSLPADGRSVMSITGRLIDAQNNLAGRNAMVRLSTTGGEFVGESAQPDSPGFYVQARDGQFTAILRAGLKAQTAQIEARAGDLVARTDLELTTALHPPMATGMVDLRFGKRENDFYKSIATFLDADPSSRPELLTTAFATGKVGSYSFTAALDNQYPINPACDGRTGVTTYADQRSCDPQYFIYGDESTSAQVAQSSDNVFLRLEKNHNYFMWGDYDSKEFSAPTQLYSATQRNLHGAKFNDETKNLQVSGFYGNNIEAFQRDNIAPDGTSGYYYLSHQALVPGTESVALESVLFDTPGVVVSVKPFVRGTDYEIDYDTGSIMFQSPVVRTDIEPGTGRILVNIIVATYEYDDGTGTGNILGGRVVVRSNAPTAERPVPLSLGATLVHENKGAEAFVLSGADLGVPLGNGAKVIGEVAHSINTTEDSPAVTGNAYRVEADLRRGETTGNAYYRTTDAGFANSATTSFIPGLLQEGFQFGTPLGKQTAFVGGFDREHQSGVAPELLTDPVDLLTPGSDPIPGTAVDSDQTTITAGIHQLLKRGKLMLDYNVRQLSDAITPALDSSTAVLGLGYELQFAKRWEFLAQDDVNLRSEIDTAYPSRVAAALAYQLGDGVRIAATQQYLHGGDSGPQTFSSLETQFDEKVDSLTSVIGRYAILGGLDGTGAQSEFGIKHRVRVARGVGLNVAYEEISGDIFDLTQSGLQFAQPYAVGQAGAAALGTTGGTSLSLGGDYTGSPYFKGSGRYEHRVGAQGDNTTYSAGAAGKLSDAFSLLAAFDEAGGANQTLGALADSSDMRIGMAWRHPDTDTTNALMRYEVQVNPGLIPTTLLDGAGSWTRDRTLALEVIHAPSERLELYGKFAYRQSTANLAGDFSNTTFTSLTQLRATYLVGFKWDVVGEMRWIGQPASNYGALGETVEAGYALGADMRGSVGYSFGRANDTDFGVGRTHGGVYVDLAARVNEIFPRFGLQSIPKPSFAGAGDPAAASGNALVGNK